MRATLNRHLHLILWLCTVTVTVLVSVFGRKLQYIVQDFLPGVWIGLVLSASLLVVLAFWLYQHYHKLSKSRLILLVSFGALLILATSCFEYPEEKLHILLFGILGYLGVQLFGFRVALVTSLAIAALDEGIQYFVPDRVADWRDVGLNMGAAIVGLVFAQGSEESRKK